MQLVVKVLRYSVRIIYIEFEILLGYQATKLKYEDMSIKFPLDETGFSRISVNEKTGGS